MNQVDTGLKLNIGESLQHKKMRNFINSATKTSTTDPSKNHDILSIMPTKGNHSKVRVRAMKFSYKNKKFDDLLPTLNCNGVYRYPVMSSEFELRNAMLKPAFRKKLKNIENEYLQRKKNMIEKGHPGDFPALVEDEMPDEGFFFPRPAKNVKYCKVCMKDIGNRNDAYLHFVSKEHFFRTQGDRNFEIIAKMSEKFRKNKLDGEKLKVDRLEDMGGLRGMDGTEEIGMVFDHVKDKNILRSTKHTQNLGTTCTAGLNELTKLQKFDAQFHSSIKKSKKRSHSGDKITSHKSHSKRNQSSIIKNYKSKKISKFRISKYRPKTKKKFTTSKDLNFLDEPFLQKMVKLRYNRTTSVQNFLSTFKPQDQSPDNTIKETENLHTLVQIYKEGVSLLTKIDRRLKPTA